MAFALSVVDDDPCPSGSPTRRRDSQGGGFGEEQERVQEGTISVVGVRVGIGLDVAAKVNNKKFI